MHTIINYLKTILTWLLVLAVVLLVLASVIVPIVLHNVQMLYTHIFLLLMFIMCLGVLRIYNGIFHNTRMMIELTKKVQQVVSEVPGLRKTLQDSNRVNSQAVGQLKETLKGLKDNSIKIDILNEKIEKWRQVNYGNNTSNNSGSREAVK